MLNELQCVILAGEDCDSSLHPQSYQHEEFSEMMDYESRAGFESISLDEDTTEQCLHGSLRNSKRSVMSLRCEPKHNTYIKIHSAYQQVLR